MKNNPIDRDFIVCNVCEYPGTFDVATDVQQVPSNMKRFQHQTFTVWRCPNCRSLHSKEAIDLDFYYEDYFSSEVDLNYFRVCAYWNQVKRLTKHGLNKDFRILDFGCNHGSFLAFLKRSRYKNATGYDPYIPKFSDRTVLDRKYDLVTTYDVIEHVEEPRDFFQKMASYVKVGGLLVVGTPNADTLDLSDPHFPELHQPYHRHILSEQALIELALKFGFEAIDICKRWYFDTLFPGVNTRFIWSYVKRMGNAIDSLEDKPRLGMVLTSPKLLFYVFAGYVFPPPGSMTVIFRRRP